MKCTKCHNPTKGHLGPCGEHCTMEPAPEEPEAGTSKQADPIDTLRAEMTALAASVAALAKQQAPQATATQAAILQDAGETFSRIFDQADPSLPRAADMRGATFDPRHRLTLKAPSKTCHITQFLSEEAKLRRRPKTHQNVVLSVEGDTQAVVMRESEAHPYRGITLSDWGAANMRLMNHLLATNALRRDEVEYYMAYTTSIFEFYNKYEWESILHFDFSYREAQQAHQFMWGQMDPSMELHYLIPLSRSQALPPRPAQQKRAMDSLSGDKQVCRQYLAYGSCRFGKTCRYTHVQPEENHPSPIPTTTRSQAQLTGSSLQPSQGQIQHPSNDTRFL